MQETVAQLGELDAEGRARAEALARSIAGRAEEFCQGQLFDHGEPKRALAVKLDEILGVLLASGHERVSWADVIAILVIGRLCEPSSELHVAEPPLVDFQY